MKEQIKLQSSIFFSFHIIILSNRNLDWKENIRAEEGIDYLKKQNRIEKIPYDLNILFI